MSGYTDGGIDVSREGPVDELERIVADIIQSLARAVGDHPVGFHHCDIYLC